MSIPRAIVTCVFTLLGLVLFAASGSGHAGEPGGEITSLAELPLNEWRKVASFEGGAEVGWTYDAGSKLFIKYGGCTDSGKFDWTDKMGRNRKSCGYSNRLLAFDLTRLEWIEKVEFDPKWPTDRPPNGCTRAHAYDPVEKKVWLYGGNASYGWGDYKRLWTYDSAKNDFAAVEAKGKESLEIGANTCQMAFDWKHRILVVLWKQGRYATFDLKSGKWTNRRAPKELQFSTYDPIVYEPESGKIVHLAKRKLTGPCKTPGEDDSEGLWFKNQNGLSKYTMETWLYDAAKDTWNAARPKHEASPRWRFGLTYDPDRKLLMLLGGAGGLWDKDERSFTDTWVYDPARNDWLRLKPKASPRLGTWATRNWMPLGYAPDHRAYVAAIKSSGTWAFRLPEELPWKE